MVLNFSIVIFVKICMLSKNFMSLFSFMLRESFRLVLFCQNLNITEWHFCKITFHWNISQINIILQISKYWQRLWYTQKFTRCLHICFLLNLLIFGSFATIIFWINSIVFSETRDFFDNLKFVLSQQWDVFVMQCYYCR